MAKILVVDDEPAILKFVVKILEARGHELFTAVDGLVALEIASKELLDVIVLDVNLPNMDGYKVCRRLKGDEATKNVSVVMMTADFTTVEDAAAGANCGADDYVIKPFLREVLIHNVERLVGDAEK